MTKIHFIFPFKCDCSFSEKGHFESIQCTVCQYVAGYIDAVIQLNRSEAAVEAALEIVYIIVSDALNSVPTVGDSSPLEFSNGIFPSSISFTILGLLHLFLWVLSFPLIADQTYIYTGPVKIIGPPYTYNLK